ncbi:uncharacterized protein [Diadema antillarum]|uniref:uncharacterized protein isoform X2 n=1 Tax=Diadema antillarum TaxID=105358 RepID=UPI003A85DBA3
MKNRTMMGFWAAVLLLMGWNVLQGDTQFCQATAPATGTRFNGTIDRYYRPGDVLSYSCDVDYRLNYANPISTCIQTTSDPTTASWQPNDIKCNFDVLSLAVACFVGVVAVVLMVIAVVCLAQKRGRASWAPKEPKVKRRQHDPAFLEGRMATSMHDSIVIDDNQTIVMDDSTGQASFVNRAVYESTIKRTDGEAGDGGDETDKTGDQRPHRPLSTVSSNQSHYIDAKTGHLYENIKPSGKKTSKPRSDVNENVDAVDGDTGYDQLSPTSAAPYSAPEGTTTGNPAAQYDQLPPRNSGHVDTHAIETSFPGGGKIELRRPQEMHEKNLKEETKPTKHDYESRIAVSFDSEV